MCGVLGAFGGLALMGLSSAGAGVPLCLAALVVSCVCSSWLVLAWCRIAATSSMSRNAAHILVSVLFARVAVMSEFMPWPFVPALILVALPFLSALLLCRMGFETAGPWVRPVEDDDGLTRGRLALVVLAMLALGLLIGAYKQEFSIGPRGGTSWGRDLVILATHTGVVLILAIGSGRSLLLGTYRATMFLLAVGCALAPVGGDAVQTFSSAFVLWSQFVLVGLVWALAPCLTLSWRGGRQVNLVGWSFAAFYASSALGSLVCEPVAEGALSLDVAVLGVPTLLLLCVLTSHFFLVREQDVLEIASRRDAEYLQGKAAFVEGCARVTDRCGLSEREAEVMARWAKGEKAQDLAESLSVSESTVRTHVRHIYTKTGAHDRDSLLDVIRSA